METKNFTYASLLNNEVATVNNHELQITGKSRTPKQDGSLTGVPTLYEGTIDGVPFSGLSSTQLDKKLGLICGHSAMGAKIVVMDEEAQNNFIQREIDRYIELIKSVERAQKNLLAYQEKYDLKEINSGEMTTKVLYDKISLYVTAKIVEAKKAKEIAAKKAKEIKKAKETKELVKNVKASEISDIQAEILKATLAGDFAKLADLLAKAQESK